MLTIFNRTELITITSTQKMFLIRETLHNAGIPSHTRTLGALGFGSRFGRGRGSFLCNQDAIYTYRVYVHKDDHHCAMQAIQSTLRKT